MTDYLADTGTNQDSTSPQRLRVPPMITLPPRSCFDNPITGLSPGPMTLVSNFFSDHYPDADIHSFSQLLDHIPPSPTTQKPPSDSSLNFQKASEAYEENPQLDLEFRPYGFFSSLQKTEESATTQISDSESSGIESLDNVYVFQSSNRKAEPVAVSLPKPVSDGYNWKKYGQKQVKASELPRSYYKCTQINCPVTKKVGHFFDGNISDIIYKGQHNHEPPMLRNRAKDNISFEEKPAEFCRKVNYMAENDIATDILSMKKRKIEVCVEQGSSTREMVSETKIVVQTRSEIDILDDGFKWRKYGQKVVKGNTYPRSYYRCTYAGCKVRKQVERDVLDPKSVVTTYEGKHKHDIPVVPKPSTHNQTSFKTERPIPLKFKEEQLTI